MVLEPLVSKQVTAVLDARPSFLRHLGLVQLGTAACGGRRVR